MDKNKTTYETPLIAVGDIHGHIEALISVINRIPDLDRSTLVFLGDLIDRGPSSKQVISFLINFKKEFPQTRFVRGNHEDMFLDAMMGWGNAGFLRNGGVATLASYGGGLNSIPASHIEFINSFELYYETENYFFVHAGIDPHRKIDDQREQDMLWIRDKFLEFPGPFEKVVCHGHTPVVKAEILPHRINVDTGSVYRFNPNSEFGNVLTACDVRTGALWQA